MSLDKFIISYSRFIISDYIQGSLCYIEYLLYQIINSLYNSQGSLCHNIYSLYHFIIRLRYNELKFESLK